MSSNPVPLAATRCARIGALALLAGWAVTTGPVAAQDDASVTPQAQAADPAETAAAQAGEAGTSETQASETKASETGPAAEDPLRINLTVTVPRGDINEAQVEECEDRAEAGEISGEIVVCRRIGEDGANSYSSREEAQKRYAEETAFKGDPAPADVAGGGIFRGPATVSGQCFLPPCPPESAVMIDVEALPQAPAGSDADRIARGLPPLGQDENLSEEEIKRRREKLGLPPPAYAKDEE